MKLPKTRLIVLGAVALSLQIPCAQPTVRLAKAMDREGAFESPRAFCSYLRLACLLAREDPAAAYYRLRAFTRTKSVVRSAQSGITVYVSPGCDSLVIKTPDGSSVEWGGDVIIGDGLLATGISDVHVSGHAVFWKTRTGDRYRWDIVEGAYKISGSDT